MTAPAFRGDETGSLRDRLFAPLLEGGQLGFELLGGAAVVDSGPVAGRGAVQGISLCQKGLPLWRGATGKCGQLVVNPAQAVGQLVEGTAHASAITFSMTLSSMS